MTDFEKRIQSINAVVDEKVNKNLDEYEKRLNKIYSSHEKIAKLVEKERKIQEESAKKQKEYIIDLLKKNSYMEGNVSVRKQIADYEKEELKALKEKNVALVEELNNKQASLKSTIEEYKIEKNGLAETEEQRDLLSKKDQARYDILKRKIKECNKEYNNLLETMADANDTLAETTKQLKEAESLSKYWGSVYDNTWEGKLSKISDSYKKVLAEIEKAETEHDGERLRNLLEQKKKLQKEMFGLDPSDLSWESIKSNAKQSLGGIGLLYNIGATDGGALGGIGNILSSGLSSIGGGLSNFGSALMTSASNGLSTGVNTFMKDPMNQLVKITSAIHKKLSQSVDAAAKTNAEYNGKVTARLQSLDDNATTYTEIAEDVNNKLAISPYVDSTKYLAKISEFANAGINFNLEQRALVGTLSEKLVSTFDALDENLTRLIRLQQRDLTYSQLGSEAQLTQFLNTYYGDTSYLSDAYDSVSGAILDATSQMDTDTATSFAYNVQKWLAALYSVGLSSNAVSTIASGINLLSTGSVSEISGNSALQNLLAMSAQNAGLSYADLLTSGMNATDVNMLMKSMVEYLQSIAENTGDQVTKSEWANILGLGVSDFRAISNLTSNDIATIYSNGINYTSAYNEYKNQMSQVSNRTTASEAMDNVISNLSYTFGNSIADNGIQYFGWKLSGVLEDLVGSDSDIVNAVIAPLTKYITGFSALNSVVGILEAAGNVVQSIFSGSLSDSKYSNLFNADLDFRERGTDFLGITGVTSLEEGVGAVSGLSYSAVVDKVATSAAEKAIINLDQAYNNTTLSNITVSDISSGVTRTVSDIYAQLFDNQKSINVNITGIEQKVIEDVGGNLNIKSLTGDEGALTKANITLEEIDKNTDENGMNIASMQETVSSLHLYNAYTL